MALSGNQVAGFSLYGGIGTPRFSYAGKAAQIIAVGRANVCVPGYDDTIHAGAVADVTVPEYDDTISVPEIPSVTV